MNKQNLSIYTICFRREYALLHYLSITKSVNSRYQMYETIMRKTYNTGKNKYKNK